jgi:hypothetical protein
MTTSMRLLPVRVTPDLRQLIDQVGAVNPASRALILLGAAAAGLDLHGLEREIARLLATDLDERVQAGLRQLLTSTTNLTPNLGTPQAIFQTHWRAYAIMLGLFAALLGGGIWLFLAGSRGAGFLIIGMTSGLLIMQGIPILRLNRGRHILLFEAGLIDQHQSTVTTIRWTDVRWLRVIKNPWLSTGVQIGLRDSGEHRLVVALDPLSPADSNSAIPAARLVEIINGVLYFVAQDVLPVLLQRYDAGEDLDFGPLTVNRQGLRVGATLVPWAEVEDIDSHGDDLLIMRKSVRGFWQRLPYHDVRNAYLLGDVLKHGQGEPFSMQINPSASTAVRRWLAWRRTISTASTIAIFALPFVLIAGWFAWDYHDYSTNPNRHSEAGYACLTRNAPAKALPSFDQALAIDPDHAPACCGRGAALSRLNQPAAAKADLERCLSSTDDTGLRTFAERELRLLVGQ